MFQRLNQSRYPKPATEASRSRGRRPHQRGKEGTRQPPTACVTAVLKQRRSCPAAEMQKQMGILILHGMSFASRRSFLCVQIRAGTLSRSASAQSAHLLGFMSGRWSLVQTQALSQCAHPRRRQCYESCSTATSDQGQRHHPPHIADVALPLESHATGKKRRRGGSRTHGGTAYRSRW